MNKKILLLTGLVLLNCRFAANSQNGMGTMTLNFVFLFHDKPLDFGKEYTTASGEMVRLEQVRLYVGEIAASVAGGTVPEINPNRQYWLLDSKDSSSLKISLRSTAGISYDGIALRIGVDSATQVQGAGSGPLDPLNGMYWTWNSGFVAVKIEGRSPASAAAGHRIEYHLGGYRSPNGVSKAIEVGSATSFSVEENGQVNLDISIELDRFFSKNFSIKKTPALMTPGPLAKELMQLFAGCFLRVLPRKSGS